jgi:hypothetical protein
MSLLAIRFPLTIISNVLDYLPSPKLVGNDAVKELKDQFFFPCKSDVLLLSAIIKILPVL